jgi:hypothetical protein
MRTQAHHWFARSSSKHHFISGLFLKTASGLADSEFINIPENFGYDGTIHPHRSTQAATVENYPGTL